MEEGEVVMVGEGAEMIARYSLEESEVISSRGCDLHRNEGLMDGSLSKGTCCQAR